MSKLISAAKCVVVAATCWLTGNRFCQQPISKLMSWLQLLQGIGSGCDVTLSGEGPVLRKFALQCRGKNVTVIDVGANHGQFLSQVLKAFGDQTPIVHCFEPGTGAFNQLRDACHGLEAVVLNQLAVSAVSGRTCLWYDEAGSGGASLTQRDLSHLGRVFGNQEEVEATTVDEYCVAHNITFVDLLKIDVEGHELDVLAGAASTFAQRRIGAVLFEFGGCNIDTRTYFRDFWRFFASISFKVWRVTPSGFVVPLPAYSEALEQFRTSNYLATCNE